LNKIDLVTAADLKTLEDTILAINEVAPVCKTQRSKYYKINDSAPADFIFDLHSFDKDQQDPFENSSISTHTISAVIILLIRM
jgi:G3E family GTPase